MTSKRKYLTKPKGTRFYSKKVINFFLVFLTICFFSFNTNAQEPTFTINLPHKVNGVDTISYSVNGQPKGSTSGTQSIDAESGDKIYFQIKFNDAFNEYNQLKCSDVKIDCSNSNKALSLNKYDSDLNVITIAKDELIDPQETYITDTLTVSQNESLSISGIALNTYEVPIKLSNSEYSLNDVFDIKYKLNENKEIRPTFDLENNVIKIPNVEHNSSLKIFMNIKPAYSQSELQFSKGTWDSVDNSLNLAVTSGESIEISGIKKNEYILNFDNKENNKFYYKNKDDDEFKSVSEDIVVTHGDTYELKTDNTENNLKLTANNIAIVEKNGIYTLEDIDQNMSISLKDENDALVPVSFKDISNIATIYDTEDKSIIMGITENNSNFSFRLNFLDAYSQNIDKIMVYAVPKNMLDELPEDLSEYQILPGENQTYTINSINQPMSVIARNVIKNVYTVKFGNENELVTYEFLNSEGVTVSDDKKSAIVEHGSSLDISVSTTERYNISEAIMVSEDNFKITRNENIFTVGDITSDTNLYITGITDTKYINFECPGFKIVTDHNEILGSSVKIQYESGTLRFKPELIEGYELQESGISLSADSKDAKVTQPSEEDEFYTITNIKSNTNISVTGAKIVNVPIGVYNNTGIELEVKSINGEIGEHYSVPYGSELEVEVRSPSGEDISDIEFLPVGGSGVAEVRETTADSESGVRTFSIRANYPARTSAVLVRNSSAPLHTFENTAETETNEETVSAENNNETDINTDTEITDESEINEEDTNEDKSKVYAVEARAIEKDVDGWFHARNYHVTVDESAKKYLDATFENGSVNKNLSSNDLSGFIQDGDPETRYNLWTDDQKKSLFNTMKDTWLNGICSSKSLQSLYDNLSDEDKKKTQLYKIWESMKSNNDSTKTNKDDPTQRYALYTNDAIKAFINEHKDEFSTPIDISAYGEDNVKLTINPGWYYRANSYSDYTSFNQGGTIYEYTGWEYAKLSWAFGWRVHDFKDTYVQVYNHDIQNTKGDKSCANVFFKPDSDYTLEKFVSDIKATYTSDNVYLSDNEAKVANEELKKCTDSVGKISLYDLVNNFSPGVTYSRNYQMENEEPGGLSKTSGFKMRINVKGSMTLNKNMSYSSILDAYIKKVGKSGTDYPKLVYNSKYNQMDDDSKEVVFDEISKQLNSQFTEKGKYKGNYGTIKNLQNSLTYLPKDSSLTFQQMSTIKSYINNEVYSGGYVYNYLGSIMIEINSYLNNCPLASAWGKASEAYLNGTIQKVYYNTYNGAYINFLEQCYDSNGNALSANSLNSFPNLNNSNVKYNILDIYLTRGVPNNDYDLTIKLDGKSTYLDKYLMSGSLQVKYYSNPDFTQEITNDGSLNDFISDTYKYDNGTYNIQLGKHKYNNDMSNHKTSSNTIEFTYDGYKHKYGFMYNTIYIKISYKPKNVNITFPTKGNYYDKLGQIEFKDEQGSLISGKTITSGGGVDPITFTVDIDTNQITGFSKDDISIKDGYATLEKGATTKDRNGNIDFATYTISDYMNDKISFNIDTSKWQWVEHEISFEPDESGKWRYNLGLTGQDTIDDGSGNKIFELDSNKVGLTPYTTPLKITREQPIAAFFVPNIGFGLGIADVNGKPHGIEEFSVTSQDTKKELFLKENISWNQPSSSTNNSSGINYEEISYMNDDKKINHPGPNYPHIMRYALNSKYSPRDYYGFCIHDIQNDCHIATKRNKLALYKWTYTGLDDLLKTQKVNITDIKTTNIEKKVDYSETQYREDEIKTETKSEIDKTVPGGQTKADVTIETTINNEASPKTKTTRTTYVTKRNTDFLQNPKFVNEYDSQEYEKSIREGTNISFKISAIDSAETDISNIVVKVNDDEIVPINGVYSFDVYEDIKLEFTNKEGTESGVTTRQYDISFASQEGIIYNNIKLDDNSTNGTKITADYGKALTFEVTLDDKIEDNNIKIMKRNLSTRKEEEIIPENGTYTVEFDNNYEIFASGISVNQCTLKFINDTKGRISYYDQYGLNNLSDSFISSDPNYVTQNVDYGSEFKFTIRASEGYNVSNVAVKFKTFSIIEGKEVYDSESETVLEPDKQFSANDNTVVINGVYTIPPVESENKEGTNPPGENPETTDKKGIITNYEIYLAEEDGIEPLEYNVELRAPTGITYTSADESKPLELNQKVAYNDKLSFRLSIGEEYNKSNPKVKIKGTETVCEPVGDVYSIVIKGDTIVEITDVIKNTYRVTFNKVEGVIYKTVKGKEFEEYLDVDYGSNIEFKITLMDAYDESVPSVLLNGSEAVANNAGLYSITAINRDVNILVENVTKNPEEMTIEEIIAVPESISSSSDVTSVIQATKAYNNLTDDEKSLVTNVSNLEEAQEQAKSLNHASEGAIVTGIDWNVKLVVTSLNDNQEAIDALNSEIERKSLLSLYEMKLVDLLTGESYEVPYGQEVSVSIPCPDLTQYQNVAVVHKNHAGGIEYLDVNIDGDTAHFTTSSFSQFGIAAKKIPNYAEDISDIKISVATLVDDDNELKKLLGEGLTSQIGELINTDGIETYSNEDYSHSNSGIENEASSTLNKIYKWAVKNEFASVIIVLLAGLLIILLILFLANRKKKSEDEQS